jgi:hypothetical protein
MPSWFDLALIGYGMGAVTTLSLGCWNDIECKNTFHPWRMYQYEYRPAKGINYYRVGPEVSSGPNPVVSIGRMFAWPFFVHKEIIVRKGLHTGKFVMLSREEEMRELDAEDD